MAASFSFTGFIPGMNPITRGKAAKSLTAANPAVPMQISAHPLIENRLSPRVQAYAARNMDGYRREAFFLSAVAFGREELACELFRRYGKRLRKQTVCDALLSAVAHRESGLVETIMAETACRIGMPSRCLLQAIRIAVIQRDIESLRALSQDARWKGLVNLADGENSHIIALALEEPDEDFITKLLDLPDIDVPEEVIESAKARRKFRLARLLEACAREREQEEGERQDASMFHDGYDRYINGDAVNIANIGPRVMAERERRKRRHHREQNSIYAAA